MRMLRSLLTRWIEYYTLKLASRASRYVNK